LSADAGLLVLVFQSRDLGEILTGLSQRSMRYLQKHVKNINLAIFESEKSVSELFLKPIVGLFVQRGTLSGCDVSVILLQLNYLRPY